MAISANSVFEIRTAGNDLNGGGFVAGAAGVDYSQQNAKNTVGNNISTTDAVANGTTTLTSATGTFTSDIVGNLIYLQGGTGTITAQWRQVTAFTNSTTVTIDQSIAASTGMTMNIGGAMASIGGAALAGGTIALRYWIKAGTYTTTSASANVAGGRFARNIGGFVIGYNATRGDYGTRPVIEAGVGIGATAGFFDLSGNCFVANITYDGNSVANTNGFNSDSTDMFFMCKAVDCTIGGFTLTSASPQAVECAATGCATAGFNCSAATMINCLAFANVATGFLYGGQAVMIDCLSYGNTGGSSDGFSCNVGGNTTQTGCVAYANGRDGFRLTNNQRATMTNCISEDNVGVGYNASSTTTPILARNCAAYSNGTDVSLGAGVLVLQRPSIIIGSGSFFTNAAGGDFSLNNTSGAGAALRETGYPGVFPEGLTTGYRDIGAAQHQGGGGPPSGGEVSSIYFA